MTTDSRSAGYGLVVIAKAPVAGKAKTRLCPPATPQESADIAAASLLDTLDAVRATPGAQPVAALTGDLSSAVRGTEISRVLSGLTVIGQGTGGLAPRLARVIATSASMHPGRPVLLIGMDTPQVTPNLITYTAAKLARGDDAVVGPATDGGFWALGLREPADPRPLAALSDTPMSRPDTGELTMRALRSAGKQVSIAATLSDVDTIADATEVAESAPDGRFARAVAAVNGVAVS